MNDKIYTIDEIRNKISPIAQSFGIERIYLFGSYARGEATQNSDLDFRVDKGEVKGLRFGAFYIAIEEALGKSVDVINTKAMDDRFLKRIKPEEILIYGN